MKHLTVDDMIRFVCLEELNDEAIELSVSVNGHIRHCAECMERVRSFQMINDEFTRLSGKGDFRRYIEEYTDAAAELKLRPELLPEQHNHS